MALIILLGTTPSSASASAPVATTNAVSVTSQTRATLNGYINPNGLKTSYWFELNENGIVSSFGRGTRKTAGNVSTGVIEMDPNITYTVRLVAQNIDGQSYGETISFSTKTGGSSGSNGSNSSGSTNTYNSNGIATTSKTPIVHTTYATNVTANGVSLNGYIDPNGSTDTTRWFEWGNTQALGNISGYASAGTNAHYFSHGIAGLERNTTYYFRAIGRTNAGTVNGSIFSFTTGSSDTATSNVEPIIMVKAPSDISANGAQLSATAIKGGAILTNGYFEWGTSPVLLNNTTRSQSFSGAASVNMYAALQDLKADTAYSFRAVVQDGTSAIYRSQTATFRTPTSYTASGVANNTTGNTSAGSKNIGAATEKKDVKNSSEQNSASASIFFAKTSTAMIGWFLAIILLIVVLILILMLRRCGKKNTRENGLGAYKEFPEAILRPVK